MPAYTDLSLSAQTAYAQLFDATLAAEHMRSIADLNGSFASKIVKGHTYWYFQFTEPSGKLRQIYVGPANEATNALVERKAITPPTNPIVALARSALASIFHIPPAMHCTSCWFLANDQAHLLPRAIKI